MTRFVDKPQNSNSQRESLWTIFLIFLRLGLTSFGGPIAHLGYFRDEFVTRRRWLNERGYVDLVTLCQLLPGPASSQVGMALGLSRAGIAGALSAWAGFTLPSAVALILFAQGISTWGNALPTTALHGLKVVAVAVVAQAVWGMARNLCTDRPRTTIAIVAACITLLFPAAWGQVGVIAAGAVAGILLFKPQSALPHDPLVISVRRQVGAALLGLFFVLLVGLPILAESVPSQSISMIDSFYRSGALVFGGGHVVLPLLQAEVVPHGWVTNDEFLAGYSVTQAVPGPLFTFAAFLGAAAKGTPTGWIGGLICLVAIFAPSFLLVVGALPFWEQLRANRRTQAALAGVNAAVVGLLLAALYHPVWTSAIKSSTDFALALVSFAALEVWKLPPWLVVIGCGLVGAWVLS